MALLAASSMLGGMPGPMQLTNLQKQGIGEPVTKDDLKGAVDKIGKDFEGLGKSVGGIYFDMASSPLALDDNIPGVGEAAESVKLVYDLAAGEVIPDDKVLKAMTTQLNNCDGPAEECLRKVAALGMLSTKAGDDLVGLASDAAIDAAFETGAVVIKPVIRSGAKFFRIGEGDRAVLLPIDDVKVAELDNFIREQEEHPATTKEQLELHRARELGYELEEYRQVKRAESRVWRQELREGRQEERQHRRSRREKRRQRGDPEEAAEEPGDELLTKLALAGHSDASPPSPTDDEPMSTSGPKPSIDLNPDVATSTPTTTNVTLPGGRQATSGQGYLGLEVTLLIAVIAGVAYYSYRRFEAR